MIPTENRPGVFGAFGVSTHQPLSRASTLTWRIRTSRLAMTASGPVHQTARNGSFRLRWLKSPEKEISCIDLNGKKQGKIAPYA